MKKRTKIVCTIGPASKDKETLDQMVKKGMNVARLNFSHGTYESHKNLIDNIREVSKRQDKPIAIMQDVQGPKIRIGNMPDSGAKLKEGGTAVFDTDLDDYSDGDIPIDYSDLHEYVEPEERLLIDDGKIIVKITSVEDSKIKTEVQAGGTVLSHKGINAPDSKLAVRAVTDKDKEDIKFGVKNDVDFLAVSFVRAAEDIKDARELIRKYEQQLDIDQKQTIRIIAKIERREALENIEEIIKTADGIMVARGDLGIEIPPEEVPLKQKELIELSIQEAKPVIVATQMLDSMEENPRPTRAEVSDVSNAVIDHTDAVMLSGESASGKYPIEAVDIMSKIVQETEQSHYDDLPPSKLIEDVLETDEALANISKIISEEVDAALILAASLSGHTGRLISRCRPELPIAVATNTERVKKQLNLSWGVAPFVLPKCSSLDEIIDRAKLELKKRGMIQEGDKIIFIAGEPVGEEGNINILEVKKI
ncbi:MAG: pyruvate kinase [Candidatus Paceibacteria bacterium]